jgi:uncharacterized protein YdeI (YjbR/CyaY-like superfamily)
MYSPQVDQILYNAPEFAQPILEYVRHVVHQHCPSVEEKIKWQFPCFEYKGKIVCSVAAFKNHCTFGFWQAKLLSDPFKLLKVSEGNSSLGNFGKLTHVSQLPNEEILGMYIMEAMLLIDSGVKQKAIKKESPEVSTPYFIMEELNSNPKALSTYEKLSNSCKREYVNWVVEAKREETKSKRLETMLEWLSEGKSFMWKYQK